MGGEEVKNMFFSCWIRPYSQKGTACIIIFNHEFQMLAAGGSIELLTFTEKKKKRQPEAWRLAIQVAYILKELSKHME